MTYKAKDRVSVLVWDKGTTLTAGLVLTADETGVKILVHMSQGFETRDYKHDGSLADFVGKPRRELAEDWDARGYYAALEEAAPAYLPPTPRAGDWVRLSGPWTWGGLKAGAMGVIDGGSPGEGHVRIVFGASVFRSRVGDGLCCSGGPATIATPVSELKPTSEHLDMNVWDWKPESRVLPSNVDWYPI